jgi:uncharacterized protein (DUF486 family)
MQIPVLRQASLLHVASNVFAPFALRYVGRPVKLDHLWAALCILGAVYFVYRG